MKTKITRAIVAAVFATAAAAAGAAEFWTYVPGNGQLAVNNPGGGAGFDPVTVTGYSGSGGQFNGNFWSAGLKPTDSFFRFFCIDLSQVANGGPHLYTSSLLNDNELRKLYDIAYPNKAAGDFWNGAQTSFGVFTDDVSAAAFQVALWNIAFDTDLDLSAGSFMWTGAAGPVSTAAQALLDQVATYSGTGYAQWTLYKFVSTSRQDYVTATYDVPEPGSLALVGLTMVGLAVVRTRRRRA